MVLPPKRRWLCVVPHWIALFHTVPGASGWCHSRHSFRTKTPIKSPLVLGSTTTIHTSWYAQNRLVRHDHGLKSTLTPTVIAKSNVDDNKEQGDSSDDDDIVADDDGSALLGQETDDDDEWYSEHELSQCPPGVSTDFVIVHHYPPLPVVHLDRLQLSSKDDIDTQSAQKPEEDSGIVQRLELTPHNVTLPVALCLLDPQRYPSLSRARKACRKGLIVIHRGSFDSLSNMQRDQCIRGRVGDRVYTGDVLCIQVRMGSGYFTMLHYQKPNFELPVVYEDDCMALVHKPAGVVVYRTGTHHGTHTIRAALPFVLTPPRRGALSVLRRPASVHRLDKATSGLLVVAKTKPALVHLSRQFHDRRVRKTYYAIVNGIPDDSTGRILSIEEAHHWGITMASDTLHGIGTMDDTSHVSSWHTIDESLDGQSAITVWRPVRYVPSLQAHQQMLTLVEMKPLTGRYHQLRRHMAWICDTPIVGDVEYDGGTPSAMKFRHRGLFLCAQSIELQHPYYGNNLVDAHAFNVLGGDQDNDRDKAQVEAWNRPDGIEKNATSVLFHKEENGSLTIKASIDLPDKFMSFLKHEEERFRLLADNSSIETTLLEEMDNSNGSQ
jgi:23S rRNA-/tRNA-specific pseudouridylate synthase